MPLKRPCDNVFRRGFTTTRPRRLRQHGSCSRFLGMLKHQITTHNQLHMTRRNIFIDYSMARAIIASSCFWQFDGNWPKWFSKCIAQSRQCRCLLHAGRQYNKIRNSDCHQLLFFTGDCTSDVSSRCFVFLSDFFLQKFETKSQYCAQVTSHVFPPPHSWTRQLASPPTPLCFIFHVLNLMKLVQMKAREHRGVLNSREWDSGTRHFFYPLGFERRRAS